MIELLRTKLFVPRPRANLVPRPRLKGQLNAGLNRKLTLIAAPAGFGKTTLLGEWIPHSPRRVAWLSLDEGDHDSTRFWAYFISSLQQLHPQLGEGALSLLQSAQTPAIRSILTALINDLAAYNDEFAIVLDDYHSIDFQPIHEALSFLIAHMPDRMHLIITTRADPPLPLARLRARDQLNEIRANDLRFTAEEAGVFLTQVMGLALSVEEVAALETRTEGWIAGLQIAALSMQDREDLPGFIEAFSGSHRHILGYLAEEVLDRQPEATLNFLLKTSILDRLCGSLCDAVLGKDVRSPVIRLDPLHEYQANDGGGMKDEGGNSSEFSSIILESLQQGNLFIIPLDDEGVWYRYHPLFAEVLQVRLQKTQPDLVPVLHHRAGNWHARQGMVDEAVRHAMAAGDYDEAARLIEPVAGSMLRQGSSDSLTVWLDEMPEQTICARPSLCLARGWAYFMGSTFSLERADEWAQLALRVAKAEGSLDSGLTGEVAALQAMIAATRGEVACSIELSRHALDDLPVDSPWRRAVAFGLGTAHYLSGNMAAAAPVFEEAIQLSQAVKEHFVQMAAASFLGEIQVFQGHLDRAMEMFKQVLAWTDPGLPQKGSVMAHGGLAHILCERGQLDAALGHVHSGIDQLNQVGGAWCVFVVYRVLSSLHFARGEWAKAFEALDRAYQAGERAQVSLVMTQAAALRAGLHLAQGDLAAAETWAENSGLSPEDAEASHPGWREVEYLTLARVLATQDRHREALSLLERLMQSAEAEERAGSAIAILAFKSCVMEGLGKTALALECLERAMALAEPEGYLRVFVDEGEPMRALLLGFRTHVEKQKGAAVDARSAALLDYSNRLLSAFSQPQTPENSPSELPVEPVSERELEVLHLINAGLTNQEIADQLVIAVSTVKTHINHLYGKFGVRSRTQAVANARELGLLVH